MALSGMRLGLSTRMLAITYGKKAIFISPHNEEDFLKRLQAINQNIKNNVQDTQQNTFSARGILPR